MTLEQLIKIVAEIVEQEIARMGVKVAGYVFDPVNNGRITQLMEEVNPYGKLYNRSKGFPVEVPDVLFIDYIPAKYLAKLALCIVDDDPFVAFFSEMLLSGKKIVVAQSTPVVNEAVLPLFSAYEKMLQQYGCTFLQKTGGVAVDAQFATQPANAFQGNVLTIKHLAEYKSNGKVYLKRGVSVTSLAKEDAIRRNIELIYI